MDVQERQIYFLPFKQYSLPLSDSLPLFKEKYILHLLPKCSEGKADRNAAGYGV